MKKLKCVICVVAALFILAPQAVLAEPIEVLNPSFEYVLGQDRDAKFMGNCPDDWTCDCGGGEGVEGAETSALEGEPLADGVCAAVYTWADTEGRIYQLTDYTINAGDEYTLMFDAFYLWASSPATWVCTYQGRLYYEDPCDTSNHIVIEYMEETHNTQYAWYLDNTVTTTVPLGHAAVGNKLGIELSATEVDGGAWIGFDTVRLDVQTSTRALNVYPPNEEPYVPDTAVLEWAAPLLYTPTGYDVYLSKTDPNADKVKDQVLFYADQTTYDPAPDLDYSTQYWWRVTAYESPTVKYPGSVWTFTTWPPEPLFTTDAAHALVNEGDSAVFSVISPNATLGFQWWKDGTPDTQVNHGDDGGDVSVVSDATSSTLTIANVNKAADEGFYYCVATNGNGSTESTHAKLEVADLLAHWTMDSPLVANQYKDETGNHHADPNNPAGVSFTTGIIGGAVEMNDERWANAGSWRPNEYSGQITVSAWIKIPDTNDITGDGQGVVSKRVGNDFDWALYVRGGDGSHPDDNYVRFTSWGTSDLWGSLDAVVEDWVHVAATVDGDGVGRLYVNGALQAVDDVWTFGANESADILIGKGNPDQYVFPGLIDDVKIYNYARDAYVIAADYTDVAGGSVCVEPVPGDMNGDCEFDLADLIEFGLVWRNCNIIPASACP